MNFPLYFSHDNNYCGTLFSRLFPIFAFHSYSAPRARIPLIHNHSRFLIRLMHTYHNTLSLFLFIPFHLTCFLSASLSISHATYNYRQSQFRCYIYDLPVFSCGGFIRNGYMPDGWHIAREQNDSYIILYGARKSNGLSLQ